MRYDRFYGSFGGQMPISYVAISTYARDHGIVGNEFGDFLRIIHKLDEVFLQFEGELAKEAEANRPPA